ncbi:MAG: TetR/AcrR family transcriptional regulator [Solirubrobacteraceae bacterium]|nr:TetR/AcrR family transcriptional regulator [Solirubrobacteraceae bacterium]
MTSASDPRVSLTPRAAEIAGEARRLLEEEGLDALSMRNIASRLGIRAASLYEHFTDKRAVENAIIASGLYEQGDYIVERLDGDPAAPVIPTIFSAFREFARQHPQLYKLIMSRDLDRDAPDVQASEQWAGHRLREEVGEYRELSLSFWAFAHGVVDLELNERFPPGFDPEAIYRTGMKGLVAHLEAVRAGSTAAFEPSED